jgi:hypothetical protein
MHRVHEPDQSHKPTYFLNDRLSALLIPVLTAIEREWRGPVDPSRRPYLRMAHMGLGKLLELELEGGLR